MARHEHEAEEVVSELLVDRGVRVLDLPSPLDVASELFVLALERLAAPDEIGRVMLRGRHEPGARTLRHARRGPLLDRRDESVLCELFSCPDVTDEASQPGDHPSRLDAPDRRDRAMRFGGYGERSFTRPRTGRLRGSR